MKNKQVLGFVVLIIVVVAAVFWYRSQENPSDSLVAKKVVINEAVRTILYLPLYHAKEKGFFEEEGIDVTIVTGGTATNSFAALLSGEAQFSQADPMYVPISREKGGKTKVVAQVVARIAVWGLARDNSIKEMNAKTLMGKTIATQPRPMTAYTYTMKLLRDLGLDAEKDVKIIETKSPNEIIPLLDGKADFSLTLEPNASIAESKGAKVILSYPTILGDQIFTGLMTTEDYIAANSSIVQAVVSAYQHSLVDLLMNPRNGVSSARRYFPQLDDSVLVLAIDRLTREGVLPSSVQIPEESWNRAMNVRLDAGDLKWSVSINDAVLTMFSDSAHSRFHIEQ